jgi:hypothetical protein
LDLEATRPAGRVTLKHFLMPEANRKRATFEVVQNAFDIVIYGLQSPLNDNNPCILTGFLYQIVDWWSLFTGSSVNSEWFSLQ